MWLKNLEQAKKAIDKILEAHRDKCGDCLYWKTDLCSHRTDQDILFPSDSACDEGLIVHFINGNVIIKQGRTQLSKPIQYLTSQATKEELANTYGLSNDEVEWTIRKTLEKRQIRERKHETPQHAVGTLKDGFVYEQIADHKYALYQDGKVSYVDRIENNKPYPKLPWPLCTEATPYESHETLWQEIRNCIYAHLDIANETAYDVLTSWTMATWVIEKWQSVPYLQFYGPFESGKTRALEILSQLSFRAWLSLYTTSANLYRPLEQWHPTLFLDESEVYGDREEILAILNAGYRRGQTVARQEQTPSGEYVTKFYDVFSMKSLASTETFAQTLVSRCITFKMSKATRPINMFIDTDQTQALRNQLLLFRFRNVRNVRNVRVLQED